MASHSLDIEEGEYVDCNSPHSESTYETESPETCGGGYPTPEDESMTHGYSARSQELDHGHTVTCTFSVSLALPLVIQTPKNWARRETQGTTPAKTREGFIPRMHRFYHIEYFLLPDDTDPRKLDLVLLGSLARLYLETESRAVRPWLENDQIWVSWNHSVEINVTNDFLIKLRDHNIQLRLWDLKEKVCSKARFGKQKPSVPHSDQDFEGAVKRTVLHQRDYVERNRPKPSRTKIKTEGHIEQKKPAGSTSVAHLTSGRGNRLDNGSYIAEHKSFPRGSTAHTATKSEDDNRSASMVSFSGSIPSSLKERTIQEAKVIRQKRNSKASDRISSSAKSAMARLATHGATHGEKNDSVAGILLQLSERRKTIRKTSLEKKTVMSAHRSSAKEAAAQAALARKFGIAFLQLSLMPLLTGERYVASQLREKSFKIFDGYLSFSVDKALLTEKQKQELNPLIIRIKSARGLPATPVPIEVLQSSCVPVYCKYKFHNMPPHQTQGRDHGTEVFFKDLNVILIGTLKPGELSEYLRGPPLEIEVHDQDKKMEAIKTKPSLFGEEPGDSKFSSLSFNNIIFRYMLQSSLSKEIWHPYGVARISLVDLLLGEKTLNFIVPIQNCSVQDTTICQGENIAEKDKGGDGSQVIQLPMGHYVNSESHLKVRVEITVPLSPEDELDDSKTAHCPYGCIIYIFDYKNTSLLSYLLEEITKINAEALQLDSYPLPIILRSLNTLKLDHKLPFEDISQLDIITGFHIMDGSIHLFILEGLKNKGLKKLWNKKIDRLQEAKRGRLQIFYNSQLSFHQRLYTDLEAIVYHIRLCKSLTSIMKHPLLYIRDMVPQPCFEALTRLDYICQITKLRDVIHHNLLPSAEMITILSREFGIPLGKDDLFIEQHSTISDKFNISLKCLHKRRDMLSPLDNQNEEYMLRKREMENRTPQDYIQGNIENLNLFNKMMTREVPQTIRAFPSDGKSIFNYSCQALNSAEITKNLLRLEMAKVPGQRFAYSHNYLSGMFMPVDEDSVRKESMKQSRNQWLSPEGFVCTGFKSSIESNWHPRMPDEARQMELKEKWEENFFNAGRFKPFLDRERWSWDKRYDDFELYKKPPLPAVTFDPHREEPKKEICCNTALKVYRRCPATELIERGPKASCQLDRFQGLLKDKPMKLSLKMLPTPVTEKFDDVVEVRFGKGFVPGDDAHLGLMANINIIPCYDRQHNLFKNLKGADFSGFNKYMFGDHCCNLQNFPTYVGHMMSLLWASFTIPVLHLPFWRAYKTVCYKHSFQHKMPSKQAAFTKKILPEDVHDAVIVAPQKKESVSEV